MIQWNPLTQPVDALIINALVTPGVARVTKLLRKNRNEKIEPYGTRGAFVLCLGRRLVEFAVTIELASDTDWTLWPGLSAVLDATPVQPRPKALSIIHPQLLAWNVTSAVVEEINGPLQDGETGLWKVEIQFLEFRGVPKVALGKPDAAKKKEPLDPVDALIAGQTQVLTDGKGGNRMGRLSAAVADQFRNHAAGIE